MRQRPFHLLFTLLALTCALAAGLPGPAAAQDFRASIVGHVTDTSGALLPGVALTAVNTDTGVSTTGVTNDSGNYSLLALLPGPYTVTAEIAGFKQVVRRVTLEVQSKPTLDFQLEPGAVEEVITVQAQTPLLEAANASRGEVITGRTLVDMPLNGRNAFQLAGLVPGTGFTGRGQSFAVFRTTSNGTFSNISMSGGQPRSNEALLDGVPNTGSDGLIQFVPSVDATSEFKVQTNSFDSEYGRFTGGVINATTKSGTNQIRGTIFEFYRSAVFNAQDFFATSKPDFQYNLFGGSIGGPLTIPGVYSGQNRTFFFFNYEGSREDVPRAYQATVPTELQRRGDFSQTSVRLSNGTAAPVTIYDPLTTRQQGGAYVRDPFPGNVIPSSRFNPIAQQILNLYPLPNGPGDPITGANNYKQSFADKLKDDGLVARVDQRFSQHQLFGRFSLRNLDLQTQGLLKSSLTANSDIRKAKGLALDDSWTIGANTLVNVRYGYTGFNNPVQGAPLDGDMTSLGFDPALVAQLPAQGLPQFTINGITTIGSTNKGRTSLEATHTFRGSVTQVRGAHTLRAGGEGRRLVANTFDLGAAAAGSYTFDTVFTRGPNPQQTSQSAGYGLASFLLGYGASGNVAVNSPYDEHGTYYGLFVQDDWRVSTRLTVNAGLRYEWEGPYLSEGNRLNRGFAFGVPNPIQAAAQAAYAKNPIAELPASQFTVTGGRLFAGVDGQPVSLTDADRNNVAPRVGAAYALTDRTVLRAGYGLFYGATTQLSESRDGFSVTTPWVTSVDGQLTPSTTLTNPFPNGIVQPAGSSLGLRTSLGQAISFVNPDRKVPYAHQFQVSVQHELPWRLLADVAYSGSRGRDLPVSHELNAIPLDAVNAARATFLQTGRNVLGDSVANPFAGLITTGTLAGATVTRGQLLRPYPEFTSVQILDDSVGSSRYDALQAKLSRRFADGFSLLAAYTLSRSRERTLFVNETDTAPTELPSSFDTPQMLTISSTYELPFGRGRRFADGARGVTGKLIEGWQVNVIYSAMSGIPLTFTGAELTGDPKLSGGDRSIVQWFDRSAFRQRETLELATLARTDAVRAPGRNNIDLSLFKTTSITQRVNVQFRAEAFNLFNHPEFSAPDTSFTSANFGRITSLNTFSRQLQFGLKLIW
jgi:hypothetical protein